MKANETNVTKLAHKLENFSVDVTGKTQAAIIQEIKDHNDANGTKMVLGAKSLSALLSGEKPTIGDWEAISESVKADDKPTENKGKKAADDAKAAANAAGVKADDKKDEVKQPDVKVEDLKADNTVTVDDKNNVIDDKTDDSKKQPTAEDIAKMEQPAADGPKVLTKEQADLAAAVEKDLPTAAPAPNVEKAKRQLNDVSHLLPTPGEYRAIKPGSNIHKLFQMMCRPDGITKKEACKPLEQGGFGWTDGGWGGIIHWEIKHKGYALVKVMKNGEAHYHLHFHPCDPRHGGTVGKKDEKGMLIDEGKPGNGHLVKVKDEEIVTKEVKVVPTPEEKAAEQAAKAKKKAEEKAAKDQAKAEEKAAKAAQKSNGAPAPDGSAGGAPVMGGNLTKRVSPKKQKELAEKAAAEAAAAAGAQA